MFFQSQNAQNGFQSQPSAMESSGCPHMVSIAAFGLGMAWYLWKRREEEKALPPLVSLTRHEVAQFWLDGMFWKAVLLGAEEARERWGASIFRMRRAGFFDPPTFYCTDASYVERIMGANGLEKSDDSYEFLKEPVGQGQNSMITRKMHESFREIRKPIMNFFTLSNIGKRLDSCWGKLDEFVKLWDDAAVSNKTIAVNHSLCEVTMDVFGIVTRLNIRFLLLDLTWLMLFLFRVPFDSEGSGS